MKKIFALVLFTTAFTSAQAQSLSPEYKKEQSQGYQEDLHVGVPTLEESVNFLVVGDWGRNGSYYQKDVADQMAKVAGAVGNDWTISVGDNFYPNGVQSTQDAAWNLSYEHIYDNHHLYGDWYVILGNHDYRGSIQAQIDYSNISRRWQMPSTYWSETFEIEDSKTDLLKLIFIDTNPFIDRYYEESGYMKKNLDEQDTVAQMKWLEEELSAAQKDPNVKWVFVVGHHPLYSGGKRINSPDTESIRRRFESMFNRYEVDAYIVGHEHDLQVIQPKGNYTVQFLSGAGSEVRPTGQHSGTLAAYDVPGFMHFSVNANQLLVNIIDAEGNIKYSYRKDK